MVLSVESEGEMKRYAAALVAVNQAKLPKPPSQAVYEVFKDASLNFKP